MYANDTSLSHQSNDVTQLKEAINNDLKRLDSWLQGSSLSLDVAKTQSMLLTTKQKHKVLDSLHEGLGIKIHENELELLQNTKYLGVKIDCFLDWNQGFVC